MAEHQQHQQQAGPGSEFNLELDVRAPRRGRAEHKRPAFTPASTNRMLSVYEGMTASPPSQSAPPPPMREEPTTARSRGRVYHPGDEVRYRVGTRVLCHDYSGVVKYSGLLPGGNVWMYGVWLDEPVGKHNGNDGSGKKWFSCPERHGVYASGKHVRLDTVGNRRLAWQSRQRRLQIEVRRLRDKLAAKTRELSRVSDELTEYNQDILFWQSPSGAAAGDAGVGEQEVSQPSRHRPQPNSPEFRHSLRPRRTPRPSTAGSGRQASSRRNTRGSVKKRGVQSSGYGHPPTGRAGRRQPQGSSPRPPRGPRSARSPHRRRRADSGQRAEQQVSPRAPTSARRREVTARERREAADSNEAMLAIFGSDAPVITSVEVDDVYFSSTSPNPRVNVHGSPGGKNSSNAVRSPGDMRRAGATSSKTISITTVSSGEQAMRHAERTTMSPSSRKHTLSTPRQTSAAGVSLPGTELPVPVTHADVPILPGQGDAPQRTDEEPVGLNDDEPPSFGSHGQGREQALSPPVVVPTLPGADQAGALTMGLDSKQAHPQDASPPRTDDRKDGDKDSSVSELPDFAAIQRGLVEGTFRSTQLPSGRSPQRVGFLVRAMRKVNPGWVVVYTAPGRGQGTEYVVHHTSIQLRKLPALRLCWGTNRSVRTPEPLYVGQRCRGACPAHLFAPSGFVALDAVEEVVRHAVGVGGALGGGDNGRLQEEGRKQRWLTLHLACEGGRSVFVHLLAPNVMKREQWGAGLERLVAEYGVREQTADAAKVDHVYDRIEQKREEEEQAEEDERGQSAGEEAPATQMTHLELPTEDHDVAAQIERHHDDQSDEADAAVTEVSAHGGNGSGRKPTVPRLALGGLMETF